MTTLILNGPAGARITFHGQAVPNRAALAVFEANGWHPEPRKER
jgi:hypothetical protein